MEHIGTRTNHLNTASVNSFIDYQLVIFKKGNKLG